MELFIAGLIMIILCLSIWISVLLQHNDDLKRTITLLTSDVHQKELKPYELVLYYGVLYRKMEEKLRRWRQMVFVLIFNDNAKKEITTYDALIKYANQQPHLADLEENIPFISLQEIKQNFKQFKEFYESTIKNV